MISTPVITAPTSMPEWNRDNIIQNGMDFLLSKKNVSDSYQKLWRKVKFDDVLDAFGISNNASRKLEKEIFTFAQTTTQEIRKLNSALARLLKSTLLNFEQRQKIGRVAMASFSGDRYFTLLTKKFDPNKFNTRFVRSSLTQISAVISLIFLGMRPNLNYYNSPVALLIPCIAYGYMKNLFTNISSTMKLDSLETKFSNFKPFSIDIHENHLLQLSNTFAFLYLDPKPNLNDILNSY